MSQPRELYVPDSKTHVAQEIMRKIYSRERRPSLVGEDRRPQPRDGEMESRRVSNDHP